jgi:hypothetical protein
MEIVFLPSVVPPQETCGIDEEMALCRRDARPKNTANNHFKSPLFSLYHFTRLTARASGHSSGG